MFHAQFSWNKKRLQTANNTLLGVFLIYKVLAHVPNKGNGCKDDFSGYKGAKIGQNI